VATDIREPQDATVTGVIRGIVDDFQKLITQQLRLFRAEVQSDWTKTKQAGLPILCGLGGLALSGILFALTLVHLLHWAMSPAGADPAAIPLWGCYGLTCAFFGLVGGGLTWWGIARFQTFNPLPDETARALEENVQWLTKNR
jgi:hypothetical protein